MHNAVLSSNCYNINESQKQNKQSNKKHVEWKKPDTKDCILCDSIYMRFQKRQN